MVLKPLPWLWVKSYKRVPARIYKRFTRDLPMIYPRFNKDLTQNKHIFIVLPSKNLPIVVAGTLY